MPDGVCSARGLPVLIDTLGADGYSEAELAALADGN